jgi:hypothetical protein
MQALNEHPMVKVGEYKPCFQFEDVDRRFPWGLLGTSARLLLVTPSALVVCNVFTTMGHDL